MTANWSICTSSDAYKLYTIPRKWKQMGLQLSKGVRSFVQKYNLSIVDQNKYKIELKSKDHNYYVRFEFDDEKKSNYVLVEYSNINTEIDQNAGSLKLSDFFSIADCFLCKTLPKDLKNKGIYVGDGDRYSESVHVNSSGLSITMFRHESNEYNLMDLIHSGFPHKWEKLGIRQSLSYEKMRRVFSELGFKVKCGWNIDLQSYLIKAISEDFSIGFLVVFDKNGIYKFIRVGAGVRGIIRLLSTQIDRDSHVNPYRTR